MIDIVIQNGRIIDGTGTPFYQAEIAIKDGKIIQIAKQISTPARKRIDASNCIVTPGFINLHSHADCSVYLCPDMESTLGQGITTEFAGHCGLGVAPFVKHWGYNFVEKLAMYQLSEKTAWGASPYEYKIVPEASMRQVLQATYGECCNWKEWSEFKQHMEASGLGANMICMVAHGPIRLQVMGTDYQRVATNMEVQSMLEYVREAMEAGAWGVSLGLDYEPGLFASREELLALFLEVAKYDGVITAHARMRTHASYSSKQQVIEGYLELLELAKEAKVWLHISHIDCAYEVEPPEEEAVRCLVYRTLQVLEEYQTMGVKVTWDVIPKYVYGPFHYPKLASLLQPYIEECGSMSAFENRCHDKDYVEKVKVEIREGKHPSNSPFTSIHPGRNPNWGNLLQITKTSNPKWIGKTIATLAKERGCDSLDVVFALLQEDMETCIVSLGMRPEYTSSRDAFTSLEEAGIGLDTWTLNYKDKLSKEGMPLECGSPATYSGMITFIENQTGVPLEKTIQKITGNPARILGLKDRGLLKEEFVADVLVIEEAKLKSNERLDDPRNQPSGIDYVIVNGKIAVEKGIHSHSRSGRVIERC